jgi:hypothetical protein
VALVKMLTDFVKFSLYPARVVLRGSSHIIGSRSLCSGSNFKCSMFFVGFAVLHLAII